MNPEDKPMDLALMRFSVIDGSFMMEPGCSMFMRNDKSEWFIDTDCDTLEGRIYISREEFVDMAKLVGYVPVADIEVFIEINKMLKERNDHLSRTVSTLRRALADNLLVNDASEEPTPELQSTDQSEPRDSEPSSERSSGDQEASIRVDGSADVENLYRISSESGDGDPDSVLP